MGNKSLPIFILFFFAPDYFQICEKYQQMTGHGLERAIQNEFSGDIMDGLIAILECTTNKAEFFAKRLHKSMAGFGTNDGQLIRIIVTRCEIDLADIKVAFERLFGKSLRSWIKVNIIIFNGNDNCFSLVLNININLYFVTFSFPTGRYVGPLQSKQFDFNSIFLHSFYYSIYYFDINNYSFIFFFI